MVSELVNRIMTEIGLGAHYLEYNGRGDCKGIRIKSAEQLGKVIGRHHETDKRSIAYPDTTLINLVRLIASNERSDYILTSTWEVASEVISAHIHAAQSNVRPLVFKRTEDEIAERYQNIIGQKIPSKIQYI